MKTSKEMGEYFNSIDKEISLAYAQATEARKQGYDPEEKVDIPLAKGIAQRVEGLVSAAFPGILNSGVAERIQKLETQFGSLDWRVALKIAEEVALEKFFRFESKQKALEVGVRVGLAYITLGVISAPLEGFIELKIKKRKDGKDYVSAFYAGPIRAAGGTAAAVSLLLVDYVRKKAGISPYDPTEKETKRVALEVRDYHERVTNLQYVPSEEETKFLLENLPIEINGDPTEEIEVSNYKDLERIETNRIRGGVCLVLAEGLAQKATKINKQLKKWGKDFGLDWDFLTEFLEIQKKAKAKGEIKKEKEKITPNYTYIKDLVAGRPVMSFPMRYGGLRLRYGRTRTTGMAAAAIHPETMKVLNNYIATGTQLKLERPGKAAAIVACDTIDPPILKLKTGDVVFANNHKPEEIEKILFLGDILFNYGDFSQFGHKLVPSGYCQEWWIKEFEKNAISLFGSLDFDKIGELLFTSKDNVVSLFKNPQLKISSRLAFKISHIFNIPLHPDYTYYWTNITKEQIIPLITWISSGEVYKEGEKIKKLVLKNNIQKETLEKIGVPHQLVNKEFVVIEEDHAYTLSHLIKTPQPEKKTEYALTQLEALSFIYGIKLRDKAGTFIGARMGRPEKAKMRKLSGGPHMLFPVGSEGGRLRSIQAAMEIGKITADYPVFICHNCKKETFLPICETCKKKTERAFFCDKCGIVLKKCPHERVYNYRKKEVAITDIFKKILSDLKMPVFPELIKGVKGTSNKDHTPEHILKGVLRAKHGIYVNKDGTTRYDMIEVPITHFKPKEIGTSIEQLKRLGYLYDIHGLPLVEETQVLELKPQDLILPASHETNNEQADETLFRIANYVDDLLELLYGLPPYYKLKTKKDITGHLVVGLAPHTSAGTVARVIGFSKTQGMFCHPLFHAAMRRNCDGDEACVILLMDALLNFSRSFLPDKRGSRTMDAPLVLTSLLIPAEVDDEAHELDVVWSYPLEFYESAMQYKNPWDVKIMQIDHCLGTERQYEKMGYTHETSDINQGVLCSAYKLLPTMEEKLKGQMELAEKIVAVDSGAVAQMVIEKHFLKDIKGNLRKFSTQQFRCVGCNTKYRRPPLAGKCLSCGGRLLFTVSEGSIVKYLEPTLSMAKKYEISNYLTQTLEILERQVLSVLGKEKEKQEGLGKWFG